MNFVSQCRTKMAMQQPMKTYVDIFLTCGLFLEEESKRILHLFCEESVFLLRKRRPLDREPVHLLADVAD